MSYYDELLRCGTVPPIPPPVDEDAIAYEIDVMAMRFDGESCSECGEPGACAHDELGRPLIHVVPDRVDLDFYEALCEDAAPWRPVETVLVTGGML